jgi:putative ABC transport system permease protein
MLFSQTRAITGLSIRSIPERWAPSLVIVIGLAGVVGVFTALLAMAAGFESTLRATGRSDAAIIMRGGSDAEINSGLTREQTDVIEQQPGIASGADGRPLASAELMVIAELIRKDDVRNGANITVRGVEPAAFPLRLHLQIIAGRTFTPGLRELIVGSGVLRQFQGAEIGKVVRMRGSDWKVVGEFESGDSHDSELWTDIAVARATFARQGSSSVLVALDGPGGLQKLQSAIAAEPRLTVDVLREQDYFSSQTRDFRRQIGFLAGLVTIIMALGAVFAALNSMYAAVAARGKEIATLRAIGFGGAPVVVSVLIEALLLALAGGVLGALLAYLLFNNLSVATLGQNFTQVVFSFKVTPELVLRGLVIALVIGMIGGLLPALRAARLPVSASLREQ